jgi:hypothetical protein
VLPAGVCVWSGNFDIGKPRLYTTDGSRPKVAAHELAHTFGMQHASTAAPLVEHEYGDHADILGGGHDSPLAQMNAPRAIKFGFIPPCAVQDVESNGTFTLEAVEINRRWRNISRCSASTGRAQAPTPSTITSPSGGRPASTRIW